MTTRTQGSDGKEAQRGFDTRAFVAYLTSFVVVIGALGLVVAAAVGVGPLERRAALAGPDSTEVVIVWPASVDATGKPTGRTWLPTQFQEAVLATARQSLGDRPDPFSREPLGRLASALAASGWFEGEPIVRRQGAGRIVVEGVWRTPAAAVRHDGKDYLISWDGHVLPPVYAPGESRQRVIEQPRMGPPMRADGQRDFVTPWAGGDMAAALELLKLVNAQPWARQVAGIDLSRFGTTEQLMLVTTHGTRVVFGGRPSKPNLGEVSTARKVANLGEVQRRFGRIDGGKPLADVSQAEIMFDLSATAQGAAGESVAQGTETPR